MAGKPRGVPQGSWVDAQIEKARRAGQFEDLPGAGKPLASLSEVHDPAWWAKNLIRREGLSVVPPAIEIRRKVEALRERIAELPTERVLRDAAELLNAEIGHLNRTVVSGPPTSVGLLDVDALVAEWQRLRAGRAG